MKELFACNYCNSFFLVEIIEMPVIEQSSSPSATDYMYYLSLSMQSVIM